MIEAPHYTAAGVRRDAMFPLPADLFDGTVNEPVLHQAVRAYLNNQRQGTHDTKTRSFVSGGNQKPWKQKGTGRARQGSTRAPHWRGGGTVFGPHPRDYRTGIPRKVRQLARRSALNARAREGAVHVIERLSFSAPKTRALVELLEKLGVDGRKVLVLTATHSPNVYLSGRNLPRVQVMRWADATAYDILWSDVVVIEEGALTGEIPLTDAAGNGDGQGQPAAGDGEAGAGDADEAPARRRTAKTARTAKKAAGVRKGAKAAAPKAKAAKKTAATPAKKPASRKQKGAE